MSLEDILMDAAEEAYDADMGKNHINKNISFDEYDNDFNNLSNVSHDDKDVLNILQKSADIVSHEENMETRSSLNKISNAMTNKPVAPKPAVIARVVSDDEIHKILTKADAEVHQEHTKPTNLPDSYNESVSYESEKISDDEEESDDDNNITYAYNHDFFLACYHGDTIEIEKHCERGANIGYKDRHGWNVFHWIAAKGYKNVFLIIAKEYDTKSIKRCINVKDNLTGWTPLHIAASTGHIEVLKLLIENGAKKKIENNFHERPLDCIGPSLQSKEGRHIAKLLS